jgi:hypothetical protein
MYEFRDLSEARVLVLRFKKQRELLTVDQNI